jgi:type III restriction enzyme
MSQVIIENPVINSPIAEPRRHFRFTDDGIATSEMVSRSYRAAVYPNNMT